MKKVFENIKEGFEYFQEKVKGMLNPKIEKKIKGNITLLLSSILLLSTNLNAASFLYDLEKAINKNIIIKKEIIIEKKHKHKKNKNNKNLRKIYSISLKKEMYIEAVNSYKTTMKLKYLIKDILDNKYLRRMLDLDDYKLLHKIKEINILIKGMEYTDTRMDYYKGEGGLLKLFKDIGKYYDIKLKEIPINKDNEIVNYNIDMLRSKIKILTRKEIRQNIDIIENNIRNVLSMYFTLLRNSKISEIKIFKEANQEYLYEKYRIPEYIVPYNLDNTIENNIYLSEDNSIYKLEDEEKNKQNQQEDLFNITLIEIN